MQDIKNKLLQSKEYLQYKEDEAYKNLKKCSIINKLLDELIKSLESNEENNSNRYIYVVVGQTPITNVVLGCYSDKELAESKCLDCKDYSPYIEQHELNPSI